MGQSLEELRTRGICRHIINEVKIFSGKTYQKPEETIWVEIQFDCWAAITNWVCSKPDFLREMSNISYLKRLTAFFGVFENKQVQLLLKICVWYYTDHEAL